MTATATLPAVPVSDADLRRVEYALFGDVGSRFNTAQRIFFQALLADPECNTANAAAKVGISVTKARRWLQKPEVREAINTFQHERMRRLDVDPDRVLLKIVHALDMAIGTAPVKKATYDAKMGGYVEGSVYETDLAAAARFTDQLGKHLKLFQPEGLEGMQVNLQMNFGGPQAQPAPTVAVMPTFDGQDAADDAVATITPVVDPYDASDLLE